MSSISIIVPCYNQAIYISECLQSVLDQTHTNWECIIVDDGSIDNSAQIVGEWTAHDSRFKYVYMQNSGLSAARNRGIEQATGTYILPLDGDDRIAATYIEKAIRIFDDNHDTGLVYCRAEYFGARTGEMPLDNIEGDRLLLRNGIFCSAIYRKEYWIKAGGYDEEMKLGFEDWEFWIRMIYDLGLKPYQIPETLFFYRQKAGSMNHYLSENISKLKSVQNYVFIKHFEKYKKKFGHPIDIIEERNFLQQWKHKVSSSSLFKILKSVKRMFRF